MDAGKALPHFPDGQIQGIYLNFSDPWPKIRHAKRRLTHSSFLREYQRLLAPEGLLEMKTDNLGLFEYSLKQFNEEHWDLQRVERDLHQTELAEDNVETEYERKFSAKGQPIYFLRACPK
jgi:tRNA (guanine-N7-)-methyltransferase